MPLCEARVEDKSSGARRRNVPVDVFLATSTPNDASRSDDGRPASVTDATGDPSGRSHGGQRPIERGIDLDNAGCGGRIDAGGRAERLRLADRARKIGRPHHDPSVNRRGLPASSVQADVGGGTEVQRAGVARGHLDVPAIGLTRSPHVDRGRPAGRDNAGGGA